MSGVDTKIRGCLILSLECDFKKCDFRELKSRESDFVMFDILEKMLIKILRN